MNLIKTDEYSAKLRGKGIDIVNRKILISNYSGSEQEKDLTEPANCKGFGRVRHFKLRRSTDWPVNPLPIVPALKYLQLPDDSEVRAQIFQNSICNWRCWYCYVDFKLLNGDKRYSEFLSCDDLIDLYLAENDRPLIIDLSGGQPDLTPEWIPWMMETLRNRNLEDKIFLWSDDNLSNDYFWQYLSAEQIELVRTYQRYARVCCFKGINEESFIINTKSEGKLFDNQFHLFKRLFDLGIDLYGYITLTSPSATKFENDVPVFLDKIQRIHYNLPLRIVPLKIYEFSPTKDRKDYDQQDLLTGQQKAIAIWQNELRKRFPDNLLALPITDIPLN
ncbi:radical SAM protein [Chitinophaga sp. GbtcB8]|uniref:radical SAM protein n=1 Tax=Chitinophaga sp. GbtcB8 TaxID=2824753 RepID=UPI001C309B61|nr:hypothetical protein [Chitinophaga sp. GbtcB8]